MSVERLCALPGIGDVTRFALSSDEAPDEQSLIDAEEFRLQREIEWEATEKARSLKAKRGITGLLAGIFLVCYFCFQHLRLALSKAYGWNTSTLRIQRL